MLKMRLQRVGRKHEPSFRLVLTESKNSTKSGRISETLGSYDARKTSEKFNTERIKHWLSRGVLLTPSVHNLLIKHKVIRGKKIDVSGKMTDPALATATEPEAIAAEPETTPESTEETVAEAPAVETSEAAPEATADSAEVV